jgi:hypothetical protein
VSTWVRPYAACSRRARSVPRSPRGIRCTELLDWRRGPRGFASAAARGERATADFLDGDYRRWRGACEPAPVATLTVSPLSADPAAADDVHYDRTLVVDAVVVHAIDHADVERLAALTRRFTIISGRSPIASI